MRSIFTCFILFISLSFHVTDLPAQSVTITESRCVNTGMVIFGGTVGAGGPYQLSAISYPLSYTPTGTHVSQSLPDTFAALFPGSYDFKIIDQNGVDFTYPGIVVPGNYVLPGNNDYNPVTISVTNCSSPNGAITGQMTNGRPPYTYTIIEGPAQAGTSNSTGNFTGLPAGQYKLQAADSCQNVQTRNVIVAGNVQSISITAAPVSFINCNTFSLNSLTVNPSFPIGGHYEIINYDTSGGSIVRASGTTLPAAFTLFSSMDVGAGRVKIIVYDACGNEAIYTPLTYTNVAMPVVSGGNINKISCDTFSLVSLSVSPPATAGTLYQVVSYAFGQVPVVYTSTVLPINFKATKSDIAGGKIIVGIQDSCGNFISTDQVRSISNEWDFAPVIKIKCDSVTVSNIIFSGSLFTPLSIHVRAIYKNGIGDFDSTNAQQVNTFPFLITGIPSNANPLIISVKVADNCGEYRDFRQEFMFGVLKAGAQLVDCNVSKIQYTAYGNFRPPVTFSISPDVSGGGADTTGKFDLPQGVYIVTATDSCGKTSTVDTLLLSRKWKLTRPEKRKLCVPGYLSNRIAVPSKSTGTITIRQYEGGMPVTALSNLLSTKTFASAFTSCILCPDSAVTGEWITYDSTLAGHTYAYVVTDSCGNADTISIFNDVDNVQPFYHRSFSKTKCVNGSDVYGNWRSYGDPQNNVIVSVFDSAHNQLLGFNSGGISNIATYPNGQILLYDTGPGVYTIEYSFINCPVKYIDTVYVKNYVQPKVTTVQSFTPCSSGSPVIVTGSDGIPPYTYAIVNSYPDHYTSPSQTSPVFTFPLSQSTVTVRVLDFCLNSSTRTVAVTRAASPSIRSNPALLSTCTLPFAIRLFTDSVYAGSIFEWTKTTGAGAGTTIISTRTFVDILYTSIADTGTYKLRVRVPNTCFDVSAVFVLDSVAVTCNPGIAGNVFDDANGLSDGIVNGFGTNAGGLNAFLINTSNTVAAVAPVSVSGTYSFTNVTAGTYSVILSTALAAIGTTAPIAVLPAGWVYTGEHGGASAGNDGTVNGKLSSILIDTTIVTELNFGIDSVPIANDTAEYRTNPGGTIQLQVPVLTGSDAEDGIYDGVSGINTIIIQSLPVNAILYYNGIAATVGQVIINYNPLLLTIDPYNGIASTQFTFSEVDAASVPSLPDTVIILFNNVPVTITSLTAAKDNKNVKISWTVAEQINILSYTVEYSLDGYHFNAIGTVAAINVSNYSMEHLTPANGINYYRLRITGNDGKISYSKIATIRLGNLSVIAVAPNPFENRIDVMAPLERKSPVKIILFDADGRLVYQNIFSGSIGTNLFSISTQSKISAGVYILCLITDDFIFRTRVVKN